MSESRLEIIPIDERHGVPERTAPEPERLLPGSPLPEQSLRNLFTDPGGRYFAGIWSSGVGSWRVRYTEHELCVLTEGRVRISDADGRAWTFGPGECFMIPAGFAGVWEVLEPTRKFYAIYEPPPAASP